MTVRLLHISDTHVWNDDVPLPNVLGVFPLKGHDTTAWKAIWQLIKDENPDAVLWSGDVATAQDESAYNIAARYLLRSVSLPSRLLRIEDGPPVYCVPGNHDHYSIVGRPVVYARSAAKYTVFFEDPRPSVFRQKIRGKDVFFFRLDSCSGINPSDSVRLASGRLHRRDIDRISEWIRFAKVGGEISGVSHAPSDFVASVNILIMHHDLSSRNPIHLLDADSRKSILKLIAALPIHLVVCGHTHINTSDEHPVFGRGLLDKRQKARLKRQKMLNADKYIISNAGTSSQNLQPENTVHRIIIDESIHISEMWFDGSRFVEP